MNEEIKQYLEPGKKNLILVYVLYLLGLVVPILPFVGAVFSYANINHNNVVWRSHYVFAFRTFVLGVIVSFVAMLTTFIMLKTFIFIGPILYIFILVWFIVRSIVAIQFLLEEKVHPNPLTFWIK